MDIAKLYKKMSAWPFGRVLFSKIAAFKAPYFKSIRPYVKHLSDTECTVALKKRHRVLNHLGTVHAIAMCNAVEFAFGLTMEAGVPKHLRWIPKAMSVQYLKKGMTDLEARCSYPEVKSLTVGDHPVPVKVYDKDNNVVIEAVVTVYISEKKKSL